jgi:hypothetical protein
MGSLRKMTALMEFFAHPSPMIFWAHPDRVSNAMRMAVKKHAISQ